MLNNNAWISVSAVELLVHRACDPSLPEPPFAIHLELAEHINKKKANTAREAAMATVRLVNHRNPHISVLALSLLNSLVQSCGYPFHLQISTKEFLNELVRRFPERPPPFPGPVMQRILDMIHGWKEGICVESRWKEDLGNIREMHRLLTYKDYRFREIPRHNPSTSADLKSPGELESEDRDAQAAKLQELIRRGTPRDLAAAQELMKIMAGADPDQKPDYRSQTMKELGKLEAKVILLNEMLDNVDTTRGERFVAGDVYDQVATIVMSARPKIQRWISDAETDDPESLAVFLQMNDQINNTLDRYESFKKGDYSAAANPIPREYSQTQQRSDLIDLDDSFSSATSGPSSTADDLAAIFGSPTPVVPNNGTSQANQLLSTGFNGISLPLNAPTPTFGIQHPMTIQQGKMPENVPTPLGNIMLPSTPKPSSPPIPIATRSQSSSIMPAAQQRGQAMAQMPKVVSQQPLAPLAVQPSQVDAPKAQDPFADLVGLF